MRETHISTLLCTALFLLACAPATPPPSVPIAATSTEVAVTPPAASPSAEPVTPPAPDPSASAIASEQPAPSASPSVIDLVDSTGDARLDPAAAQIKAGQHADARAALEKLLPDIDKGAPMDVKMAAHALLGRACKAQGDAKCADKHYEIVRVTWKDPAAATAALDALGGTEKAKEDRLRRALNAASEALFQAAEEKRLAADSERMPAYTGKGDMASVKKHIETKVATWMKARMTLIRQAEKAYVAVTTLSPAPSPQWVVASASRVGVMWGKFVAELRAAPIPHDWAGTGPLPGSNMTREEIRASYYEAIDEAAAPQRDTARAAFKKCQEIAAKLRIQNDYTKHCDAWLAKSPAP